VLKTSFFSHFSSKILSEDQRKKNEIESVQPAMKKSHLGFNGFMIKKKKFNMDGFDHEFFILILDFKTN
jgi:hypothetical protein